jgi:hypothetical protein
MDDLRETAARAFTVTLIATGIVVSLVTGDLFRDAAIRTAPPGEFLDEPRLLGRWGPLADGSAAIVSVTTTVAFTP